MLFSFVVFFGAFCLVGDDIYFGVLGEFDVSLPITENWVVDVRVQQWLRVLSRRLWFSRAAPSVGGITTLSVQPQGDMQEEGRTEKKTFEP